MKDAIIEAAWTRLVRGLRGGKRVGTSVYLHRSAVAHHTAEHAAMAHAARLAQVTPRDFDLVKFSVLAPSVSLLAYPGFFDEAFPVLSHAYTVDMATERVSERDYSRHASRPILHRKELFLAAGHPRRAAFAAMTARLEDLGLFYGMNKMGTERPWAARLRAAGVVVDGNDLSVTRSNPATVPSRGYSPDTSLDQVSKLHTTGVERGWWSPGDVNVDVGGGRYATTTRYLRDVAGVHNHVYDTQLPAAQLARVLPLVEDGRADTATIANVLNVIPDADVRLDVLRFAQNAVRPGGVVFVLIHEGDGRGAGRITKHSVDPAKRSWQEHRKTSTYLPEVRRVFPNARALYGLIVATNDAGAFPVSTLQRLQRPVDPRARAASKAWLDAYKVSKRRR